MEMDLIILSDILISDRQTLVAVLLLLATLLAVLMYVRIARKRQVIESTLEQTQAQATAKSSGKVAVNIEQATVPQTTQTSALSAPIVADASVLLETKQDFMAKTRTNVFGRLRNLFTSQSVNFESAKTQIEEALLAGDLGVKTTDLVLAAVAQNSKLDRSSFFQAVRTVLIEILTKAEVGDFFAKFMPRSGLKVILLVGVNGAGKTTTLGKLANQFQNRGLRVLVAAGDTFRAAATEQLSVWAERSKVEIIYGAENAKPATIAYQAIHQGLDENFDVVLIDTAGRLQNRLNLMNELKSLAEIIKRELPGAPHETLLVVDGTTGNNALVQAREFSAIVPVSGVVVTKLDGSAKGGAVVGISHELNLPITFIGIGEKLADLRQFKAQDFVDSLLDLTSFDLRTTAENLSAQSEAPAQSSVSEQTGIQRAARKRKEQSSQIV
ncbi:signal recognition particle-docking protein FtsY [bacterium]|nr:signal recognition particle-docking protein FtsY [bacterium]